MFVTDLARAGPSSRRWLQSLLLVHSRRHSRLHVDSNKTTDSYSLHNSARPTLSYIDAAITLISMSVLKGHSLGFSRRNTLERRRTFRQMSVCGLSVCPVLPPHAAAAGLLLWARRAGDIDRLLHGRRSAASCSGRMRAVLRRQLSSEAERRLVPSVSACLTSPFERCCRCRL